MAGHAEIAAPLELRTKQTIAAALWSTPAFEVESSLSPYFKYYVQQCEVIALQDGGSHVCIKTHQDIAAVAVLIREDKPWRDVYDRLLPSSHSAEDDEKRRNTVNLVARLLSMVEIGNLTFAYSGFRQLEWSQGSLRDFVRERFPSKPMLDREKTKLEKMFNARNIGLIGGIEIEWTANLADHLRLMRDDKAVAIFHHASFLRRQQRDKTLFPEGLVAETLNSLALLFPKWDRRTRTWYTQEASLRGLDAEVVEIGHLDADQRQIENFSYWHDRLIVLKQVFDEARPNTLVQWWNDRRNGVQWYTFWVAILVLALTIFFGLVQSIEGALQVYKAYHPE